MASCGARDGRAAAAAISLRRTPALTPVAGWFALPRFLPVPLAGFLAVDREEC
jgi:hypothetical protein